MTDQPWTAQWAPLPRQRRYRASDDGREWTVIGGRSGSYYLLLRADNGDTRVEHRVKMRTWERVDEPVRRH